MKIFCLTVALGVFGFLAAGVSAQILLNELDINPGGTDNPCEYVELIGTPGAAVENLHFVSLEGDIGSTPGVATAVITFGTPGPVLGANGLLVVTGTQTCGTRTYPAGTTVIPVALLDAAGGALQNGTNSFLFISSTTAITPGTDYDTNNDGTLELPAGATVVDGVAWSDGGAGDITYGTVVLTATGGTIGAATRFPGNTTPNSAAAWYAGAMVGTNDATTYSATIRTANFPANGALTPGAPNVGTTVAVDAPVDYNGDGRSDYVVVRNTGGGSGGQVTWFINFAGGTTNNIVPWGISTDFFVAEDFDGDDKDDITVYRPSGTPSLANFYILQSGNSTMRIENLGLTGDDPTIVDDYDGDGKADVAVYRAGASAGQPSTWYYRGSLNNPSGNITYFQWGVNGDFPAPGDYDGDGRADFVVQRNGGGGVGQFWMQLTTAGFSNSIYYGTASDLILPGDYDGDGKTDVAVARASAGQIIWFYRRSTDGVSVGPIAWGNSATDFATQGDYDGDGKTDIAVWRPNADPTQNFFWVRNSSTGATQTTEWGQQGDYPVANFNSH